MTRVMASAPTCACSERLLLAAELHRGIDLDGEPAAGRLRELLAEGFDRRDGRIAERMHVGRFQHHFLGDRRARNPEGHGKRDAEIW